MNRRTRTALTRWAADNLPAAALAARPAATARRAAAAHDGTRLLAELGRAADAHAAALKAADRAELATAAAALKTARMAYANWAA